MIRIAVIDDHDVVRLGVRYMLKFDDGIECAGELSGGEGAGEFVRNLHPDVTLLDVKMPGVSGVEALRDILSADPSAKVIMLTTSSAEEDVYAAVAGGAKGYVLKDAPPTQILAAIRAVAEGGECFSDDVRRTYEVRKESKGLSDREMEIMRLVVRGLRNREIGEMIGVSENAVKLYLKRAYAKLHVADRAEAVAAVISRGIVVP